MKREGVRPIIDVALPGDLIGNQTKPPSFASSALPFLVLSEEAQTAIGALNGTDFGGRTLTVNEARPQEDRAHGDRGQGGFNGRGTKRDRW